MAPSKKTDYLVEITTWKFPLLVVGRFGRCRRNNQLFERKLQDLSTVTSYFCGAVVNETTNLAVAILGFKNDSSKTPAYDMKQVDERLDWACKFRAIYRKFILKQ